ncbi:hypothetical protein VPH35_139797 [Triticum aestivum]|uniref:Uncharacterized protein n=1 Tax=Aegilops tauschii TaxID=37682 RepID=M8D0K9_AEGTA
MAAKRQHGVEMQAVSTLKALRSVGVLDSMQSIGDVAVVLARLIRSNLGPAPAVYGALAMVLSLCNCNSMTLLRLFCGDRGDASDQAAAAYSLEELHKGAAKISNDILDSVGVSVYATTKNSTIVYVTNGAICVRCNLLILTRVECPTFPKMAPKTCPQPEPAKLSYKKLGDSDLS